MTFPHRTELLSWNMFSAILSVHRGIKQLSTILSRVYRHHLQHTPDQQPDSVPWPLISHSHHDGRQPRCASNHSLHGYSVPPSPAPLHLPHGPSSPKSLQFRPRQYTQSVYPSNPETPRLWPPPSLPCLRSTHRKCRNAKHHNRRPLPRLPPHKTQRQVIRADGSASSSIC